MVAQDEIVAQDVELPKSDNVRPGHEVYTVPMTAIADVYQELHRYDDKHAQLNHTAEIAKVEEDLYEITNDEYRQGSTAATATNHGAPAGDLYLEIFHDF